MSLSGRPSHARALRSSATLTALVLAMLVAVGGCRDKKKSPLAVDPPPPSEGQASLQALSTPIGGGRALEVGLATTSTEWKRAFQLPKILVFGGQAPNEATALRTEDGGKTWTSYKAPLANESIVGFSAGLDGTIILSIAKRMIPTKPLPKGQIPPLDSLELYFAAPGERLSAASPILAPGDKVPTIPKGYGGQAVLSKTLTSFTLELAPKKFGVAYGVPPGEALPPATLLPPTETPIYAAYGRPPLLITATSRQLLARAWPEPAKPLVSPTPIDRVVMTKTLIDELSEGPECEYGSASYKRISQPNNKTFVFAVTKGIASVFELPDSVIASSPLGCDEDKVIIEAINPVDKDPSLVTCPTSSQCIIPDNRPFFKQPWADKATRKMGIASAGSNIVSFLGLETPTRWGLFQSNSSDNGKIYNPPRALGENQGDRGRIRLGALGSDGSRVLALVSADVMGTQRRGWFVMATDDGGQGWNGP